MAQAPGFVREGGRLSPLMATLRARRAERLLRGARTDRLLDVGCGHYPYFLTRSSYERRCGIDREPGPRWPALSKERAVHLAVADVQRTPRLPFRDASLDAVTMLAVVEHLDARVLGPLLADIRRVLREGGRLVLTTPPPWSDPVLRVLARAGLASRTELEEHQAAYSPGRLRALLQEAGFRHVRAGLFELGLNAWACAETGRRAAKRSVRRSLLGILPALLVLAGVAGAVVRERSTFAEAVSLMSDSSAWWWAAALGAVAAGRGLLAGTAYVAASRQIAGAAPAASAYAWLRSAITKYVPGIVWYPLTAVDRLRRFGVSARRAALAFYVDAVGSIVAALIVGAVALPAFVADQAGTALWLLLALPAALSLHPRVFGAGLRVVGRLTSRGPSDVSLRWRTVGTVVALHLGSWLLAGVGLQLVLRALGAQASWTLVFAATALSWAVGLLVIPVPAGLGIREAALVGLLVAEIPASAALAAALVSRALFVALDVAALGASFPAGRTARRTGRTSTDRLRVLEPG